MPSLWERLYGLATMPDAQAQGQVRGILSGIAGGVADTVKVPGQMMTPNPYPAGSEEASFFDASKTAKAVDWAPEMALNTMGTGAIAGVPVKGGEVALGSGIIRPVKEPPLVGTYHGTGSPNEYTNLKLPPATHDLGIHTTIDPSVAAQYAYLKATNKLDFMSGMKFGDPNAAGVRIKPLLTDVQSALKYPTDAVKWNVPGNVIEGLESHMRTGFTAPRGLLEDMYNISSPKTWREQFIPMLKDRGYDSLFYPHGSEITGNKYNTFMTFDPEQVIPRFSQEGFELAQRRGVKEPMKDWEGNKPWRIPKGILHDPSAVESLVKLPEKNTFAWWAEDAPPSKIKSVFDEYHAQQAIANAKYKEYAKTHDELMGVSSASKFNPPTSPFTGESAHLADVYNPANAPSMALSKPLDDTEVLKKHYMDWKKKYGK